MRGCACVPKPTTDSNTAEQTAAMKKAHKEALEMQQRQEEQGGRGKRARKPKPQAEEPASVYQEEGEPQGGEEGEIGVY